MSIIPIFIRPPINIDGPRPEIENDPKFSPYFDEFDGGVDGCHIQAIVPLSSGNVWRNRKGFNSQNVLIYFGFDLQIYYILAGWEGSAHDGNVLDDAIDKGFPRIRKKLVDAAYTQTKEFIKPYPGQRYHLKEFGPGPERPQNPMELFNLRHSMKRNCSERGNGVFKKRFPVLSHMLHFKIEFQVQLIQVAACIHNWIRRHNSFEDDEFDRMTDEEMDNMATYWRDNEEEAYVLEAEEEAVIQDILIEDAETGAQWRDRTAQQMWIDYQAVLAIRGLI